MPRFFCPAPLTAGQSLDLPAGSARHVQVLRLQPGAAITLFNGEGGEFDALVEHMGRSDVRVLVTGHTAVEREARHPVHLVVGIPANERMDWLVEKATELGAASIWPLVAERGILKLKAERADKKRLHWQGIAVAACEQCGRNRVPTVHPVLGFGEWLSHIKSQPLEAPGERMLLSLRPGARSLANVPAGASLTLLSGPEGGLSPAEEDAALAAGFGPITLGPRVLRAETAPLAALSRLE
jgi:16S rRNA (uracil1498-N3)-methyltransferase